MSDRTNDYRDRCQSDADAEVALARLLQLAGRRTDVPPERERRVRRAVLDECRAVARERRFRRVAVVVAAVASAAALGAFVVRVNAPIPADLPGRSDFATVERSQGGVARIADRQGSGEGGVLSSGDAILVGDEVEVGERGRLALRRDRTSLRLDHGTKLRFVSGTAVDLRSGALYVDNASGEAGLEVRTPFGAVRDIGTQFEVRLVADALRVRVRSGQVELRQDARLVAAGRGMELSATEAAVTSRQIPPHGPEWEWALSLAPPLEMEGQRLAAFLERLCREQGWSLSYQDPKLEADSRTIVLHGSVQGLSQIDALSIVLETSGLEHQLDGGKLMIRQPRRADRPR